jgi:hypothetical protein
MEIVVNGKLIPQKLIDILHEIHENGIEEQKNLLTRNCLFIAGLYDPGILPIDQEFFIVQSRLFDLLCALEKVQEVSNPS